MFSIKIAYKGKNILLPKGTDSIKKIEDELLSRFPGDFANGVGLTYQGNAITEYTQIQDIVSTTGVKSLKIQAEQKSQRKFSSVIREEKKQEPVEKVQVKDVEVKVEQVQVQPKVEVKQAPPAVEVVEQPVEVPVTEIKQEKQNKPEEVEENNQVIDISIDSMSSDLDIENEEPEKVIPEEKKEIEIEQDHKPQIIKCQIFSEEIQPEPVEVKCTIYNQIPKIQEKIEQKQEKIEEKQELIEPEKEQVKPEIIKCAIFGSEIKQPQPKIESQIKEKQLPDELREISPGVYECIFCRPYEVCNVCDTKRKLDENSKLIVLINKIVDKRINEKLTNLENQILAKLSQQPIKQKEIEKPVEKKEQKSKISNELREQIEKEIDLIKAAFIQIENIAENKRQIQLNEEIEWMFHIKIKRQMAFRHKACLIEERSGETISIDLTNSMFIKVGPFKAEKQGKLEKTYRICIIKDDGSMQMFGPRIGFSINVIKPKVTKVLTNNFRKYLEQTKKAYKCEEKPTEYLIERLRELGIVEENYEESKSLIPEIICTL